MFPFQWSRQPKKTEVLEELVRSSATSSWRDLEGPKRFHTKHAELRKHVTHQTGTCPAAACVVCSRLTCLPRLKTLHESSDSIPCRGLKGICNSWKSALRSAFWIILTLSWLVTLEGKICVKANLLRLFQGRLARLGDWQLSGQLTVERVWNLVQITSMSLSMQVTQETETPLGIGGFFHRQPPHVKTGKALEGFKALKGWTQKAQNWENMSRIKQTPAPLLHVLQNLDPICWPRLKTSHESSGSISFSGLQGICSSWKSASRSAFLISDGPSSFQQSTRPRPASWAATQFYRGN